MMHKQHTVALNGLDPVSYFRNGPTQGDATLMSDHGGAVYYFSSGANKAVFDAAPDKYAPQYGGWCATAMSEGTRFGADPTNFTITNDRLFVFYRGLGGDTRPQWNQNPIKSMELADKVWREGSYTDS